LLYPNIRDRSQSKQSLLIADANPEKVNVLKTMLAPDYDIKVATDGEEAIRLASSPDTPELILLKPIAVMVLSFSTCLLLRLL
jgi:putative two-component system response regulator